MRLSLLASASRLPASRAATVAGSPAEPRMARPRGASGPDTPSTVRHQGPRPPPLPLRRWSDDLEQAHQVVDGREHEEDGVEAVEHASVPGKEPAEVLHSEVALQHR